MNENVIDLDNVREIRTSASMEEETNISSQQVPAPPPPPSMPKAIRENLFKFQFAMGNIMSKIEGKKVVSRGNLLDVIKLLTQVCHIQQEMLGITMHDLSITVQNNFLVGGQVAVVLDTLVKKNIVSSEEINQEVEAKMQDMFNKAKAELGGGK